MSNMTFIEQTVNGKTQLCQVTPYERNMIAAGHKVSIPAARRTHKRLGIPRSMQLHAAGLAFQPVIF